MIAVVPQRGDLVFGDPEPLAEDRRVCGAIGAGIGDRGLDVGEIAEPGIGRGTEVRLANGGNKAQEPPGQIGAVGGQDANQVRGSAEEPVRCGEDVLGHAGRFVVGEARKTLGHG